DEDVLNVCGVADRTCDRIAGVRIFGGAATLDENVGVAAAPRNTSVDQRAFIFLEIQDGAVQADAVLARFKTEAVADGVATGAEEDDVAALSAVDGEVAVSDAVLDDIVVAVLSPACD